MVKLVDEVVDEKCRNLFYRTRNGLWSFDGPSQASASRRELMRLAYLEGYADGVKAEVKRSFDLTKRPKGGVV